MTVEACVAGIANQVKVASQNSPTAPGLAPGYPQNPKLHAACGPETLRSSSASAQLQAPRTCAARSQRRLSHRAPESISVVSGHLRGQISPAKPIRLVATWVCLSVACLLRVRPCSQSTPISTRYIDNRPAIRVPLLQYI